MHAAGRPAAGCTLRRRMDVQKVPNVRTVVAVCAAVAVTSVFAVTAASGASAHHASAAGVAHATKAAQAHAAALRVLRQIDRRQTIQRVGAGGARVDGLTQLRSFNWSGYGDDNSGGNTYTKVTAKWTVPKVTCTKEDRVVVFWTGIDGLTSSTVEQDGTLAQCFEGTAFYGTWWEMYPTNAVQVVGTTVKPGDAITSTVSFSSGKYHLTVTDATTTGNNVSKTAACGSGLTCSNASAEWIGEAPTGGTGQFPLAQFAPWKVTGAEATSSGHTLPISGFPDDEITMIDSSQTYPLAKPSALSGGGEAFTDTWKNSF